MIVPHPKHGLHIDLSDTLEYRSITKILCRMTKDCFNNQNVILMFESLTLWIGWYTRHADNIPQTTNKRNLCCNRRIGCKCALIRLWLSCQLAQENCSTKDPIGPAAAYPPAIVLSSASTSSHTDPCPNPRGAEIILCPTNPLI